MHKICACLFCVCKYCSDFQIITLTGDFWLSLNGDFRILSEPTVKAQAHHSEECFAKYATAHFAGAFTTVHKDNGHLLQLEAIL